MKAFDEGQNEESIGDDGDEEQFEGANDQETVDIPIKALE